MRSNDPDRTIRHAEVEFGDSLLMVGTVPGHEGPATTGRIPFGLYVHVDNVEEHFERTKAAGAQVQDVPTDQPYGVRSYGVLDPEGNQWWFAQPLAGTGGD